MSNCAILRTTLASVTSELERLDPSSLIAARARGVLDATDQAGSRRFAQPPQSPNQAASMAARYAEEVSGLAVAAEFGVDAATVYRAVHAAGGTIRARGPASGFSKIARTRLEEMVALRAQGKTLDEIGEVFKVTRERVRQILTRGGYDTHTRPLKPEELQAAQAYADGASLYEMAAKLKVTELVAKKVLRRAGIPLRKRCRASAVQADARAERIAELYASGSTLAAIVREVGLKNPNCIYRYLARAGVDFRRRPKITRLQSLPEAEAA